MKKRAGVLRLEVVSGLGARAARGKGYASRQPRSSGGTTLTGNLKAGRGATTSGMEQLVGVWQDGSRVGQADLPSKANNSMSHISVMGLAAPKPRCVSRSLMGQASSPSTSAVNVVTSKRFGARRRLPFFRRRRRHDVVTEEHRFLELVNCEYALSCR